MEGTLRKTVLTLEMIKFSHSVFALPFALASMIVAAKGWPDSKTFFLILAAMVTARSASMAFNRIIDSEIDAKNPRTATRHLPQGTLSKSFAIGFTLLCVFLFLVTCYLINSLSFLISPFVILFLFFYSYTKRWTWLTHLWLGLSLAYAPLGAWVAVTNEWPWPVLPLAMAVVFWVAGFDIIYATQDYEFDKREGVYSIVARFGIPKALWSSRLFHCLTILFFILFGIQQELSGIYWFTLTLIALGLLYEQSLLSPTNLSKVNAAFFNMNGLISLLFLIGIGLEFLFS